MQSRRTISRGKEASDDINAVIGIFATRRLLLLEEDTVEISHDVLLHAWKQLRDWLDGDKLDRVLYAR